MTDSFRFLWMFLQFCLIILKKSNKCWNINYHEHEHTHTHKLKQKLTTLVVFTHPYKHRGLGQRAALLRPKGKKRLLSLPPPLLLLFTAYLSFLSINLCLSFTHSLLPSLSPSLSLFALGNTVIIKAKEYLWVLTSSISLCTLWPAIIPPTHATHTCTRTYTHTHAHIVYRHAPHTLVYQVVTELHFDW